MKTVPEIVIVHSNRWLKIEVTARQKSVFAQCLSLAPQQVFFFHFRFSGQVW